MSYIMYVMREGNNKMSKFIKVEEVSGYKYYYTNDTNKVIISKYSSLSQERIEELYEYRIKINNYSFPQLIKRMKKFEESAQTYMYKSGGFRITNHMWDAWGYKWENIQDAILENYNEEWIEYCEVMGYVTNHTFSDCMC